jgi:hypothetical protein
MKPTTILHIIKSLLPLKVHGETDANKQRVIDK